MATVTDIIFIAAILFSVGLASFFIVDMSHRINFKFAEVQVVNDTPQAVTVLASVDSSINYMDYIYLSVFISFFLAIIISGYLVGGYPVMVPIYFIIVMLFTFVAVILQLVIIDLAATPQFVSMMATLPITSFIMQRLGYFIAIMGLIGIISMYAKPSSGGESF